MNTPRSSWLMRAIVVAAVATSALIGPWPVRPVTAFPPSTPPAVPESSALRLRLDGEPGTLDPALAGYAPEVAVAAQVFEGLTRLDEALIPQPGLANGWSYSSDASVYTFTLRDAFFANGRRIVASDVVSSLTRALSPALAAPYAPALYDIQGAESYNNGDIGAALGLAAPATRTVRISLTGTVPPYLFLKKLSMLIASVIPLEEVAAGGDLWWADPNHLIGAGPYRMTERASGDHITLAANPQFHGNPPAIGALIYKVITDSEAALAAYQSNQFDIIQPAATQMVTLTASPILASQLITGASPCTAYATLDNLRAPFSGTAGMALRQAFNYAIDRTLIVLATPGGAATPAKGLQPPSSYGYDPSLRGLEFNVVSATQKLAASGYAGAPPILFYSTASNTVIDSIRAQVLSHLGISVNVTTTASAAQMRIRGWCTDYPDPDGWLPPVLRSAASYNYTHYSNPTFDTLVDQAGHTLSETARLGLYRQAEQLAVSDGAMLPLYHYPFLALSKPWVSGPVGSDLLWSRALNNLSYAPGGNRAFLPSVLR